METASNIVFHNNNTTCTSRGQNCNFTWDSHNNITPWDLGTTSTASCTTSDTTTFDLRRHFESLHHSDAAAEPPACLFGGRHALYGLGGAQNHPDPHLMCLKLGKRNYFEDPTGSSRHVDGLLSVCKRGKSCGGGGGEEAVTVAIPATVPRCQVEGCHVALLNAKSYHRRHKVCEFHSKAPKVVVLGSEQRFCQQCSRFHIVTEFDDTKRSCRRRLAGHNERRRKSSHEHSTTIPRNNINPTNQDELMAGRFSYLSSSSLPSSGRALSLLSSRNESSIPSSPDLHYRCSAALRELIAENRASLLAKQQVVVDKDWPNFQNAMEGINMQQNDHYFHHSLLSSNEQHVFPEPHSWLRFDEQGANNNVTLDLMQAPTSAFQLLSMRAKSKEDEESCSQLWNSFSGTHVI